MEKESIFESKNFSSKLEHERFSECFLTIFLESKNFASKLEHEPFSECFLTIFLKSILIFSMRFFASSHVILLYVIMLYSCLWHSFITSDLCALIGPRFVSVSFTQTFTFLFFINKLSDLFSLLDNFVFLLYLFQKEH